MFLLDKFLLEFYNLAPWLITLTVLPPMSCGLLKLLTILLPFLSKRVLKNIYSQRQPNVCYCYVVLHLPKSCQLSLRNIQWILKVDPPDNLITSWCCQTSFICCITFAHRRLYECFQVKRAELGGVTVPSNVGKGRNDGFKCWIVIRLEKVYVILENMKINLHLEKT